MEPAGSPPPTSADGPSESGIGWASVVAAAEGATKVIGLGGAILYAAGLIVSNTYLATYGASDFTLVRPQCILTGTWSAILVALAAFPATVGDNTDSTPRLTGRLKSRVARLALFVGCLYVASMLAGGLLFWLGCQARVDANFFLLDIGVPGWRPLIFVMSGALFVVRAQTRAHSDDPTARNRAGPRQLPVLIVMVCASLFMIGNGIYGMVGAEVGGGRLVSAHFLFGQDGGSVLKYLRTISTPFHDADGENILDAELIYATSDRYVIRVGYCTGLDHKQHNKGNIVPIYAPAIVDKKLVNALVLTADTPTTGKCPYEYPSK